MSLLKKLFGGKPEPAPDRSVTEAVAKLIGCEWELVDPALSAEAITALYIDALQEGRMLGYHPLLVAASTALLESLQANYEDNAGFEAYRGRLLIEEADSGAAFLRRRYAESRAAYEEYSGEESELIGSFDEQAQPQQAFAAVAEHERGSDAELILVHLPITKPWRCFAYVPMGDFNDAPSASEMMAVCRYWYERDGAFPAMLSHDVLQLYVPVPVTLRTQAMSLSEEQYGFCNDIVDQGTGTLGGLASILLDSHIWYFWWD